MSIANENNRIDITATATQTTFAYNFKINAESEIAVYLTPTGNTPSDSADLLTLTTDYTLTGVGNDAGGNIVLTVGSFPTGAAAGDVVVAVRNINFDQQDAYVVGQDNAENFEASLDRMTMRIQRLEEELDRCTKDEVTGTVSGVLAMTTGTWTPVLEDINHDGTGEGQVYGSQTGHYMKFGSLVFVQALMTLTDLGTLSSNVFIGGLPYANKTNYATVHFGSVTGMSITAGVSVTGRITAGNTYIEPLLWELTTGVDTLKVADLTATPSFVFSAIYRMQ